MAQDPNADASNADADQSQGLSWKGMIQAAKDKKNEIAEKMEKLDKDTTDISTLMTMALKGMVDYEKRLNDLADDTENKINLLSQFTKAKGIIYIHSIKVGVGLIGGSYGRGIIINKADYGWSLPLAITKPEVKIGPQVNAIEEDQVILLKSNTAVTNFVNGKTANLSVGFDAFMTYDTKGQSVNADNGNVTSNQQKGIGGGATIDFGNFNDFTEANKLFYGNNYEASRILNITLDTDSDVIKNLDESKLTPIKKFIDTLEGFVIAAQDEAAQKKN